MPAIEVVVCFAAAPVQMVLASPAIPGSPISILLLPVVRLEPALLPTAILKLPCCCFGGRKRQSLCCRGRSYPQQGQRNRFRYFAARTVSNVAFNSKNA